MPLPASRDAPDDSLIFARPAMSAFFERPLRHQLRIGQLVTCGAMLVAAVAMVASGMRATQLARAQHTTVTRPLAELATMRATVLTIRLRARDLFLEARAPGPAAIIADSIHAAVRRTDSTMQLLHAEAASDPALAARLGSLESELATYRGTVGTFLAQRLRGDSVAAYATLVGTMKRDADRVTARINGAVTSQIAAGDAMATRDAVHAVSEAARSLRMNCVAELRASVQALAAGDLSRTVGPRTVPVVVTGGDELAMLGGSINAMIADLQATIVAYDAARGQLGEALAQSQALADACRGGDLAARADAQPFAGAYRTLMTGMNDAVAAMAAPIATTCHALERLAARDLTVRVTEAHAGDFARMGEAFNATASALGETLSEVIVATQQVDGAARAIAAASHALAAGATAQAGAVSIVAATFDDTRASTGRTADGATLVRRVAGESRGEAATGAARMRELATAMAEIRRASRAARRRPARRACASSRPRWPRSASRPAPPHASPARSTRSPSRRTSSRSTPRWRRHGPAMPGVALPSSPRRCARSRSALPSRHARPAPSSVVR